MQLMCHDGPRAFLPMKSPDSPTIFGDRAVHPPRGKSITVRDRPPAVPEPPRTRPLHGGLPLRLFSFLGEKHLKNREKEAAILTPGGSLRTACPLLFRLAESREQDEKRGASPGGSSV